MDINKLLETLDGNSGGNSSGRNWFKPRAGQGRGKEGNQFQIRFLPNKIEGELPVFTLNQHYFRTKDGQVSGVCPKESGQSCPACDMFFALVSTDTVKNDATLRKALQKLAPTNRFYANIVDRNKDNAIAVFSMPYSVAQNLKEIIETQTAFKRDIFDLENGFDIVFSMSAKGNIPQYGTMAVWPESTPAGVDLEEASDLEEAARQRELTTEAVGEVMEALFTEGDTVSDSLMELYREAS